MRSHLRQHLFMINHHLQRCVIPHLLTVKRGINHLQVVNQVDPGCKGSHPSRPYPGRLTGTNLMVMMGVVNPLGVSTRGAQATTQIGDIMEADLGTWTENIIEITEMITEMIAGTIEGNFFNSISLCHKKSNTVNPRLEVDL